MRALVIGCGVVAALMGSGCFPDADLPGDYSGACDNPFFAAAPATSVASHGRFHAVGTVREVFKVPSGAYCVHEEPRRWGELRVTAPDGTRIPAWLEELGTGEVDVVFEATTHGSHHVDLWFHPAARFMSRDLLVARPTSAMSDYLLPGHCPSLQRTTKGAWICGQTVVRDGEPAYSLPGETEYFGAGDFVWGLGGDEVFRYEDLGKGELLLRNRAELVLPRRSGYGAVATESELVVSHSQRLFWFAASSDGTLQKRGEAPVGLGHKLSRLGDLVVGSWGTGMVAHRLMPSGEIVDTRFSEPARLVSDGRDGLWAMDGERLVFAAVDASRGFVRLASAELPADLAAAGASSAPFFRMAETGALAFVREGAELVPELLPTVLPGGANDAFVWELLPDGTTRVRMRR